MSKTPLIQFLQYSCEFHNSDASIVLVQSIFWVMRVLNSSGSISHHPDCLLGRKHNVTPFPIPLRKHLHRILQNIVLLERSGGLLGCRLGGRLVLLCLSGSVV